MNLFSNENECDLCCSSLSDGVCLVCQARQEAKREKARKKSLEQYYKHREKRIKARRAVRKHTLSTDGWLYLFHISGTAFYKLGFTRRHPKLRLKEIRQRLGPFGGQVRLIAAHPDVDISLESQLQGENGEFRVLGTRDWFEFKNASSAELSFLNKWKYDDSEDYEYDSLIRLSAKVDNVKPGDILGIARKLAVLARYGNEADGELDSWPDEIDE